MPALCEVDYICQSCGAVSSLKNRGMICEHCGGALRGHGCPGVTGTKDGFGFRNQFRDDSSGKVIDNWSDWERAGYRNPLEVTKNHDLKEKIKRKVDKIKRSR